MTTRSKEELLVEIPKWMKHFDDEDGGYTYEFSIHIDDLKETFDMLNSFHSKCANWFATTCKTCEGYHGKGFVHIELEHDEWSESVSQASNLLARTNYKREVNENNKI